MPRGSCDSTGASVNLFKLDFPCAYASLKATARFKQYPEDFYVEERLGFELSGSGEHLYLFVEKTGCNTQMVAGWLAEAAGIQRQDVSYAGLKDRHAVARQWFSLYLPKKTVPVWKLNDQVKILQENRHTKKLRTGDHQGNFFSILLRDVEGDLQALDQRLILIREKGVPNYFGEQRFGHQGSNLANMDAFLNRAKGKQRHFQDRMRVSAMRSWLFNAVLSERLGNGSWFQRIEGERGDNPSGPLWGRGRLTSSGAVLALEQKTLEPYANWCQFLEHCGLQQDQRLLVLKPDEFNSEWKDKDLQLRFYLPAGAFATMVLHELCELKQSEERAPPPVL